MAYKIVNDDSLTSVANAIRVQGSISGTLEFPDGFVSAIQNLSPSPTIEPLSVTANGTYSAPSGVDGYSPVTVNVSGGGGGASSRKDVNFFDYDGTLVESYTAQEWASQTALPSNPSHSGLTAQGWNYTKAQIDAEVTAQGRCDIGQMYITESGDTEIDIELLDGRLNPKLGICPNGTVEIDWGDGSAKDTVTGTSLTTTKNTAHIYASGGAYTIKLHVVSGSFNIYGASSSSTGCRLLWTGTNGQGNGNRAYQSAIKAIRLGAGITGIDAYAFQNCFSLEKISLTNSVASIGGYAFNNCYHLMGATIPSGMTSLMNNTFHYCYALTAAPLPNSITTIGANAFNYCDSLETVTIPSSVVSVGSTAFSTCRSLRSMALPNSVTSIGYNAFSSCPNLVSVVLPNSITSMGNSLFSSCASLASAVLPSGITSLPNSTFSGCYSLRSVTIPSGATSIGQSSLSSCYSLVSITIPSGVTSIEASACTAPYSCVEIHVLPTTPPTLGNTNAFASLPSDCKIYVPAASLEDYKAANNWSSYSSRLVGE